MLKVQGPISTKIDWIVGELPTRSLNDGGYHVKVLSEAFTGGMT